MKKKILFPFVSALILTLFAGLIVSTSASAKAGDSVNRHRRFTRVVGKVTAVTDQGFSIQTRQGKEISFEVDENTQYRNKEREEMSFDDIKIDGWIAVAVPRWAFDKMTARLVILLPQDFDPTQLPERFLGEFVEINKNGNEFRLKTRQEGEEITFSVTAETHFRSKGNTILGLGDIEPGMVGAVVAKTFQTGEQPNAVVIAAGERGADRISAWKPMRRFGSWLSGFFDKLTAGKAVSITDNSIELKVRNGEQLNFQVTGNTVFRSRDNQVTELEDIQEDMTLVIGARDLGNMQYQAQIIFVFPARK